MVGNSFSVKLDNLKECIFSATESKGDMWHKRFGHFSLKTLKFMYDSEMVNDLLQISSQSQTCPSCTTGKIHRKPFPTSTYFRAAKALELVHSDICGPVNN